MNRSKITSIVAITIAAALLASSIAIASPVFAKKGSDSSGSGGSSSGTSGSGGSSSGTSGSGGSSSSSKSDYDKFQKCLSDDATGGSATKQQIKDCFSSTYGGGSRQRW